MARKPKSDKGETPPPPRKDDAHAKSNFQNLPSIILNSPLIFPYTLATLVLERKEQIDTAEAALKKDRLVAVYISAEKEVVESVDAILNERDISYQPSRATLDDNPIYATGTLVRIVKSIKLPDGNLRLLVRGMNRITFWEDTARDGLPMTSLAEIVPHPAEYTNFELATCSAACSSFVELVDISPFYPDELKNVAPQLDNPERTADAFADTLNISTLEKIACLILPSIYMRFKILIPAMIKEIDVARISTKIQRQVHESLNQNNKEHFLREQLEAIRSELGEGNDNPDITDLLERREKVTLSEEASKVFEKELQRLASMMPASPDYALGINYLDWLISVPWNQFTEDQNDIINAQKVLNEDHYGLDDIKDRILEFLAVLQIKKSKKAPILCFVGPPGVGKTSLGQSIARAMNRQFVRVSLGGVRDESDIRGHRRTYIGALPGRIISGMKRVGSSNPVFMLDEIDKMSNDFKGDPASALLEVLDPAQNQTFVDHYLDVDYDLSNVFFIATANMLELIPGPLRDRMEIITLSGYTVPEKKKIAQQFLVPRQLKENGIDAKQLIFTEKAVEEMIVSYTSEAGVRSLERTIASVCRKYVLAAIRNGKFPKTTLTPQKIRDYLGAPIFLPDEGKRPAEIGVATGMAWTADGGCILPVECTKMPGKGDLKLTGSLGDVMKESAIAALSYIKANATKFNIKPEMFNTYDIHIHVPDGATPKDGPSAGITISSVLFSVFTDQPVSSEYAMTGEINLRGKVTAIGGLKEKSIAALRSGLSHLIVPKQNEKDLEKIPEDIRKEMYFHFVETISEAFALLFKPTQIKKTATPKRKKSK